MSLRSARSICTLLSQADCVLKSGSTALTLWRGSTKPAARSPGCRERRGARAGARTATV